MPPELEGSGYRKTYCAVTTSILRSSKKNEAMDKELKQGDRVRYTLGIPYSYIGGALDEWSQLDMPGKMTLQKAKTKGYIALTMELTAGNFHDDRAVCWLGWVKQHYQNVKVDVRQLTIDN